jgi:hypothetical protein
VTLREEKPMMNKYNKNLQWIISKVVYRLNEDLLNLMYGGQKNKNQVQKVKPTKKLL